MNTPNPIPQLSYNGTDRQAWSAFRCANDTTCGVWGVMVNSGGDTRLYYAPSGHPLTTILTKHRTADGALLVRLHHPGYMSGRDFRRIRDLLAFFDVSLGYVAWSVGREAGAKPLGARTSADATRPLLVVEGPAVGDEPRILSPNSYIPLTND